MVGLIIAAVCILALIAILLVWIGWALSWGNIERHRDAEHTLIRLGEIGYKLDKANNNLRGIVGDMATIRPYMSSLHSNLVEIGILIRGTFAPPEPKPEQPLTKADLANVRMVLDKPEK